MRSLYKQALLSTLFVALLSPAAFCADAKPAQQAQQATGSPIIARVNGKDITAEHHQAAVNNLMPSMSYHTSVSERRLSVIQKRALSNLINNELMYAYAKDNNKAEVDKKEIDQKVEDLKKNLPEGTTLKDVLKRSNMTMDQLLDDFRRDIVVARTAKEKSLELRKEADEMVTEDFMLEYYNNNLPKFKEPEKVRLRTLLIKADPSGGVKVWNASRQRIDNILATINQGMDFAEAAREYSEDPYAENGGDMGWAHKGSIMAEFDAAIADLKVGEIAGPFASLYGYHLAKLEDSQPAVQKKFEELNHATLKSELQDKEFKRLWYGWIQSMRDAAKIEYITPID